MKIALSLTGHMRNYDEVFHDLKKNILEKFDVDIYIHTYDTLGYTLNANRRSGSVGSYEVDGFDKTSPSINEDHIRNLYKPKTMIVEKWKEIESSMIDGCSFIKRERYRGPTENPMNPWCMFRKIYLSWLDIQNSGKHYDYVIRHRPDMFISTPPIPEDDFILIPEEFGYKDFGVLCDCFAIGKTNIMEKYFNMWTKIKKNYEDTQEEWERTNSPHIQWNPHVFLEYHLRKENVSFKSLPMGLHK